VKIIVVSPHLNDAAFSLSLAIESWIAARHKVVVLNCFSRSQDALYSDFESVHANDRPSFVTALRRREDAAWNRQFGSGLTVVDLNMKDAPLRLHCSAEEVYGLTINPEDKWLLKIRKAIEAQIPNAVLLPLGLGGHMDHLVVRQAGIPFASSDAPCGFYEDIASIASTEQIEEQVENLSRELKAVLAPAFAAAPCDVADATARKRRAALHYDSQIDDAEVNRIATLCNLYQGRERIWANSAWFTSALA
jgi:LmbE family N-acetylglucosaminyl deacetylase